LRQIICAGFEDGGRWRNGPEFWQECAGFDGARNDPGGIDVPVPGGGARMLGRAVVPLNRAVVPLALLGYAAYLVLGVTSPKVAWLAIGGVLAVASILMLWPFRGLELLAASPGSPRAPLATALMNAVTLVLVAAAAAAAVALVVRFRRARGVERQQIKWLTSAGAVAAVGLLLFLLPSAVGVGSLPDPLRLAGIVLMAGGVLGIPVAVGVGILRYRLYDIDRLINRTLVYGLLTALLGALYAGVVLVGGQLFGGVGAKPPRWAVAGATLAAAALFQPVRRRLQATVDRRFNRRRYHAAQTIEAFSARLRQQVDLDSLSAELLAVVDQTMEPTQVSLWLRAPAR
jgi:hypothetical protein